MPNREEKTIGELVEERPPHHEIAEVPKLKTKLGCATSRNSGARTQPQQTGKGFQLSACNPSELQQHHPTSGAASQLQPHSTAGHPSERTCQFRFSRLFYPSIQRSTTISPSKQMCWQRPSSLKSQPLLASRIATLTPTASRKFVTISTNFEEDCHFNDGQGVNETEGA